MNRWLTLCLAVVAGCGGQRVEVNGPVEPPPETAAAAPARATRPSPLAPVLEASNVDLRRRTYETLFVGPLVLRGGTLGFTVETRSGDQAQELSRVVLPGSVTGLELVRPGLVAAACASEGVFLVDITDPAAPRRVGHLDTPWSVLRLHARGDVVLAADGSGGVAVLDLTRPEAPREVGRWASVGHVTQVRPWRDGLALVAEGRAGLAVLDVNDPSQPTLVARLDTDGEARAVDARDDLAFVADFHQGVVAVDVTDPSRPRVVGRIETSDSARDVVLAGGALAVATGVDGVLLVAPEPAMPTLGRYETGAAAVRVAQTGERLAVVNEANGVEVLDVSRPATPVRQSPVW